MKGIGVCENIPYGSRSEVTARSSPAGRRSLWLLLLWLPTVGPALHAEPPSVREVETCEEEAGRFEGWSKMAWVMGPPWRRSPPHTETLVAGDGRSSWDTACPRRAALPAGYVLLVQGNAMLAKTLARPLRVFQNAGLDVFLFDFRGYGRSQPGEPRVSAIIQDYSEIISALNLKELRAQISLWHFLRCARRPQRTLRLRGLRPSGSRRGPSASRGFRHRVPSDL